MAGAPGRPGFELTLAEGVPVWVRPVVPSDREGLRQGYREMSRTSRYMRFFTAGAEISAERARYFTEVDQRDHVAWCAVEPVSNLRGYGIARFVRDTGQPDRADFAIALIDEMQGKGLGTILLAALYLLAQARGICELRSEVLPDNPILPRWLPTLGASITSSGDPSYRLLRWPIRRGNDPPADTPAGHRFAGWLVRLRPLVGGQNDPTARPDSD